VDLTPSYFTQVGGQAARAPSMEEWSDDLAAPAAGEPASLGTPKVLSSYRLGR